MIRHAACSCGALRATAEGDPARVSICHCLDCKRRTGSAFAYNATFEAARIRIDGDYNQYSRTSDEGYWARMSFCPKCGATLFYEIERRPGMITIPAGAFADRDFPEPTVSVYGERRHDWLEITGTLVEE